MHPRWRVCNIHAENFDEIIKRLRIASVEAAVFHKTLSPQTRIRVQGQEPVTLVETAQVVDEGDCVITDARIAREWFRSAPCVCYARADWRRCLTTCPDKYHETALQTECAEAITVLIHPAVLAALGGADARVRKCMCWLAIARQGGLKPETVLEASMARAGYTNRLATQLTKEVLLRHLGIAAQLGCLDAVGLAELREGRVPARRPGVDTGSLLSSAYIVPPALAPELDRCLANVEWAPRRTTEGQSGRVGSRPLNWARQLHQAGLLSDQRLAAVNQAARKSR